MHRQTSFPLRIPVQERRRAKRLASATGLSENRLYADLIQEGLLMREQMAYLERLRTLAAPAAEGLAFLDLAPGVRPATNDRLPGKARGRPARSRRLPG